MYTIDDLLGLIVAERAEHLLLRAGMAPVLILKSQEHTIEGPPLDVDNANAILSEVAGTRRVREIRVRGVSEFVFRFRKTTDFLVQAMFDGDNVHLDFKRIPA